MGLGLGAALRFLLLCAAFLVALRAVFLAFPRALFRATRSPPLRLTCSFLRLVGPLQQTSAGVLPQGQHSSQLCGMRRLRGGMPAQHMRNRRRDYETVPKSKPTRRFTALSTALPAASNTMSSIGAIPSNDSSAVGVKNSTAAHRALPTSGGAGWMS
jgi:hypothetical protein